jgi:hypothetical protein
MLAEIQKDTRDIAELQDKVKRLTGLLRKETEEVE